MKKAKQYIQKKNSITSVMDYLQGTKVLILIGAFNAEVFKRKIISSLNIEYECIVYEKECTQTNVEFLVNKMKSEHFDSIIGFGGGKILDVAKALTYFHDCFLMVIPSSASMDGACSALSVLYHEDHSFDRFLMLPKNPDVVLVDSQIIFEAPFFLLCAGMADAISSYYDTLYVLKTTSLDKDVVEYSQNCHDVIFNQYQQVKKDYEKRSLTQEVESVIRTNIYDSAIAFENAGCEFSHVLANATTKISTSKGMHGERVGVSTLFQLKLMNLTHEYKKVYTLLKELKMPTTLFDLQIDEPIKLLPSIIDEFKELNITYTKEEITKALLAIKK